MEVFGGPGLHARELWRAALRRCVLLGVVAAVLVIAGLALGALTILTGGRSLGNALGVVLIFAAAGCIAVARTASIEMNKAAVGVRSERKVAKTLARGPFAAVCNGLLLGKRGGDADHMVFGPQVVVVETKTGHGRVGTDREGRLVAGQRTIPGDPCAQAKRSADQLARLAGMSPDVVVCIPDMSNRPFRHNGVVVCSASDILNVIATFPQRMGAEQALTLAHRLAYNAAGEEARRHQPNPGR